VCINQADQEEKMVQIREMNRVYRQAKKVWVWLGITEHQKRIPDAVRFLKKLRKVRRRHPSADFEDLEWRLYFQSDDLPLKSALYHLLSNHWFGRVWVIQEAALPQDISFISGDTGCSWELMRDSKYTLSSWLFLQKEFVRCEDLLSSWHQPMRVEEGADTWKPGVFFIRQFTQVGLDPKQQGSSVSASILLKSGMLMSLVQDCGRPEDRVLGLLGLINPMYLRGTCLDPKIAYVSFQDLYTRFTTFIQGLGSEYDNDTLWKVLSLVFEPKRSEALPSWVPDFHRLTFPGWNTRYLNIGKRTSRCAAVKALNVPRSGPKLGQLVLLGRVLDEIATVYEMMPAPCWVPEPESESILRGYLFNVAGWEDRIANDVMGRIPTRGKTKSRVGVAGQITSDEYWHTLVDHEECYMRETITRDWYPDFQATGLQLRGVITDKAIQKYAFLLCTDTCQCAYTTSEQKQTPHIRSQTHLRRLLRCNLLQKTSIRTHICS
jgi:hypothetical protein